MQDPTQDSEADASGEDMSAYRPDVVSAVRQRLQALVDVEERTFTGPPIAGLPLQPLELGELLVDLSIERDHYSALGQCISALWVGCRAADVQPALTGHAAERAFASIPVGGYAQAADFLGKLVGEPSLQVLADIRRIVGPSDAVPGHMPSKTYERFTASPGMSTVLMATNRMLGRLAASQMAAASLASFLPLLPCDR